MVTQCIGKEEDRLLARKNCLLGSISAPQLEITRYQANSPEQVVTIHWLFFVSTQPKTTPSGVNRMYFSVTWNT